MRTLGIRELRDTMSEVLRAVEEDGEVIEVTNHGRVVARLVPVHRLQLAPEEIDELIAAIDSVAAELGARWPMGVTAMDALDDVRG